MSDLKSFVSLQARLYEFLEQQDETTLQAIAKGTARLTVAGAEAAAPSPSRTPAPSSDPLQVAQDLPKIRVEDDRREYLKASGLNKEELKDVARAMKTPGFSGLVKDKLIDLLASYGLSQVTSSAAEPSDPAGTQPDPPGKSVEIENFERSRGPAEETTPNADVTAVVAHLRELETEEEGATYLREQNLDRDSMLAVAAELQLTRVTRLSRSELERRVLKQAIGARRKFAGLMKW